MFSFLRSNKAERTAHPDNTKSRLSIRTAPKAQKPEAPKAAPKAAPTASRDMSVALGARFTATPTKLGSGAYGAVLLGREIGSSEAVAIKFIPDGRMRKSSLDREVAMLERLSATDHPALVKFYGRVKPADVERQIQVEGTLPLPHASTDCHALIMEAARGGELFDHVVKAGGLDEKESAPLVAELCDALDVARRCGIAHRDLKLENVLLTKSGKRGVRGGGAARESAIKLIDWGLAHQHELARDGSVVAEKLHSRCGSKSYMAPEVTQKDVASKVGYDGFAADMWSLGVCLFAMHLAFFPFEQADPGSDWRAQRVLSAQREGRSTMETILSFYPAKAAKATGLSAPLLALLDRLLLFDPRKRATLSEVLASGWLAPHMQSARPLEIVAQQHMEMRLSARTRTASASSSEGLPTPRSTDAAASSRTASTASDASARLSSRETLRADTRLERCGSADTTSSAVTASSVASSVSSASASAASRLGSAPMPTDAMHLIVAGAAARPRKFTAPKHASAHPADFVPVAAA